MKPKPRVKLCGMFRREDIQAVNRLRPDYVGFVFYPPSHRNVTPEKAAELKALLEPGIQAVGVFADAEQEFAAELLNSGLLDLAQLHGHEDEAYIASLRRLTDRPLIQAFRIASPEDARRAEGSTADYVLLDSGMGSGVPFDWRLVSGVRRPYFLAGGLTPENLPEALSVLRPFALDVSSGIETNRVKDPEKMAKFMENARR